MRRKLGFYISDITTGYRIESGILGNQIDSAFSQAIAVTGKSALNLIVPTVISHHDCLNIYRKALEGFEYALVYVDCERSEIQRRETARGDILRGTSLDLLDRFETKDR